MDTNHICREDRGLDATVSPKWHSQPLSSLESFAEKLKWFTVLCRVCLDDIRIRFCTMEECLCGC